MSIGCVTHGTTSAAAQRMLRAFYRRASKELGEPVHGWTLDDVEAQVGPGDRVFGLFFTVGGHVRRDLLPVLERKGASFVGAIPPALTAALVVETLRSHEGKPGRGVLLVHLRSRFAPAAKEANMAEIAREIVAHGYPTTVAYYDDAASLPEPDPRAPPLLAFLMVLLPGYTLGKAPDVLRARGYEVLPGPWLPQLTPGLLRWMASDRKGPSCAPGR